MKTKILALFAFISITWASPSKEIYMNFDGQAKAYIGQYEGTLDSLSPNPLKRGCNKSERCAKYLRKSSNQYDNIKIMLSGKLNDVSRFATNRGFPPRMTMKVFSSSRPGTIVELQFGTSKDDTYPSGIHSQYQATTTSVNKWEELTFNYLMSPKGSKVSATDIDKIVLLFAPGTRTGGIYYFDELQGPLIINNDATESAVIKAHN